MDDWISMPLVGFPLVASIVLLAFVSNTNESMRRRLANPIRMATLVFSLVLLVITTGMFFQYFGNVSWEGISFNNYEFLHRYSWMESLGIHWSVGMDALSFPMVWLTTFLLPVTIIATWNEKNGATYFPILLAMGGALIGVFVSLDLFMFYVFWELTLIPMFFLILMWGGADRKYASQKFFIYTFTASVVMLL
ncbi:MAG: proton-conducting transporter membrane subunit, partial [Candidatus Poseidoniaceae archaeon]